MAPKKRPGKYKGIPKGLIGWVDLSGFWDKSERSMFQLKTRTMRGRRNRTEVINRAQHIKNELLKLSEKMQQPVLAPEPKTEKSVLATKDPLAEYGVTK